ncbi:MAG: hypothetical protein IPL11_08575 [Candidatus Accumulibacter sp.]|nr:hypothetical protein [Accumulibacter sp.]
MRIDTVHQGDQDGVKGVYHITCVDAVSQWQVEACVQGISEAFLLPVLALDPSISSRSSSSAFLRQRLQYIDHRREAAGETAHRADRVTLSAQ